MDTCCAEKGGKYYLPFTGVDILINKLFQEIAFEEYPTTKSMITKTACIGITYLKKTKDQMDYLVSKNRY